MRSNGANQLTRWLTTDGAYSAVRQVLYKNMLKKGLPVPKSDMAPLRFDSHCVIGVTDVLSPEEYPVLEARSGDFQVIIGKERSLQVYLFPFAENRIGWQICGKMENPEEHDQQSFRFSDWVRGEETTPLVSLLRYRCLLFLHFFALGLDRMLL